MKIELKKETRNNGDVFYWTFIDGERVSGTCTLTQEEGEKMFSRIVESKGVAKEETLKIAEL